EGVLYTPDFRLRPDGNKGPLASSLQGFLTYQRDNAWTWEHMSLLRARIVHAAPAMRTTLDGHIRALLAAKGQSDTLHADIADMRRRIAIEFPAGDVWNPVYTAGGKMDVLFATQYLAPAHGAAHPD